MTEVNFSIEDMQSPVADKTIKKIIINGQLDESNVDEKSKIIYQVIEENPKNLYLIFDFENLEYMNSKSIGYLTDWYGKIFEGGGKVYIVKARENIFDILQVVGLTQLVQCFPTLEEATAAVSQDVGTPAQ